MTDQERQIAETLAGLLERRVEELSLTASFADLGVDSFIGLRLVGLLSRQRGKEIDPLAIFDYPSIRSLGGYLMDVIPDGSGELKGV